MTGQRLQDPDDDMILLERIEFDFALPCYVTHDQQHRLHKLIDEVASSPENQPVDGVHWLAGWGSKPKWREPQEPTFDDTVLHGETCAREFVSDKEKSRKLRSRNLDRAALDLYEACRAVLEWYGRDPKAFGDEATLGSCAASFGPVADKCRAAIEKANQTCAAAVHELQRVRDTLAAPRRVLDGDVRAMRKGVAMNDEEKQEEANMLHVAKQWAAARNVIATFLGEISPYDPSDKHEQHAACILARLAHAGILICYADELKD